MVSEKSDLPTSADLAPSGQGIEVAFVPRLIMLRGPDVGRQFMLRPGLTSVGRAGTNDVVIDRDEVSRHHCMILTPPPDAVHGGVIVRDLGSTNGTAVSNQPVGREGVRVPDGGLIAVGRGVVLKVSLRDSFEDQAHRRLYSQAAQDTLTGLANRRAIEEHLKREVELATRGVRPVSLLVVDIDHFKRVNDTYGHDGGDLVLREVAGVLGRGLRGADRVGRWGGEEFVIVLPDTQLAAAHGLADRLRHEIANSFIVHDGQRIQVSASFGVASSKEIPPGELALDLFRRADRRLYAAKQTGRNRVVSADPEDPSAGGCRV
ncbi:MAG: GGDEF domain-containing protein [Deltaproteobacteria bacterium]|nr:GGDEF domain-containing protein [Deltaproteobacteria bacterium]